MKIHKKTKRILSTCISALTMVNAVILPLESNLSLPKFKVSGAETDGVAINEENFPDPIFRDYVNANFDTTDDDVLDEDEIAAVIEINVSKSEETPDDEKIESLKGIEYFTQLAFLNCNFNKLTTLDASNNTALTVLYCDYNQLTSLNLNNNTALIFLNCHNNQLANLDISNNIALTELYCYSNQLASLDVSNNSALTHLICVCNQLTTLDVCDNSVLNWLECNDNQLTTLDISNNTALTYLNCYNNNLTSLDVSNNTNLTGLDCSSNNLTYLDISNNTALTFLACFDNNHNIKLISNNFDLTRLPEGFDISKATNWYNATVDGNILTVLNPKTDITYLYDIGNGSSETFKLRPVSCEITEDMISPIEPQYYTGEAIEPEIVITCGDYTLIKDTDYIVSYENNINPGTATATITAVGDFYTGEILLNFNIEPKIIDNLNISIASPVVGEIPQDTIISGDGYNGVIHWTPQDNPFDFNKVYTASIILTPDNNHQFCEDTTAEGFNATYNTDGTLTLIKDFTATEKAKLISLIPPEDVCLDGYYNNVDDIIALLPENVAIESENGITELPVTWELVGEFNADSEAENIFAWNVDIGELDADKITTSGEITVTNTKYVAINNTNFPDDIFRSYVDENFDVKDDGVLTNDEILDATIINISASETDKEKISNLKGIEFFTELMYLYCDDNSLTEINISNNTALTYFSCRYNQLTSLNISQNTNLQEIQCEGNLLTELNTINNIDLYSLNCASNNIANLDLSKNTALASLICWGNQLEDIDLSNNSNLVTVWINSNNLESLNLSNNPKLYELYCGSNKLNILDISNNKELSFLECNYNSLSELDVRNNKSLETLWCSNNKLTTLDVSNNTNLTDLDCSSNNLTNLDISKNTVLTFLACFDNNHNIKLISNNFDLTTLPEGFDISKATNWYNATVDGNILTILNPQSDITYSYDLGNGYSETFTLRPVSCEITEDMISPIEPQYYIGEAIEPEIIISCGEYTLERDVDYTVIFENNINVGTATYTIKGIGEFFTGTCSGEWKIEKNIHPESAAIPMITATYGDTLANVELPDGFTWQEELTTSVGEVGENVFLATYTPEDTTNYEIIKDIELYVIVEKAIPVVNYPTASEIVYGQALSESILSENGWEWVNPNSVPGVVNESYKAIFYIKDGDNYDYTNIDGYGVVESTPVIIKNIPVAVKKAIPEVSVEIPDVEYTEGDSLPELIGILPDIYEGIFEWLTELANGLIAGENTLEWQFTPDDIDNYEIVIGTAIINAQTTTTTTSTTTTSTTTSTTTTSTTTSTTTTSTSTTTSTTTTSTTTSTTTTSTTTSTTTTSTTTSTTTTSTTTSTTTTSTTTSTTTTSTTTSTTTTSTTTSTTTTSTTTSTTTTSTTTSTTTTSTTTSTTTTSTTTSTTTTSTTTSTTTTSTITSTTTTTTTTSTTTTSTTTSTTTTTTTTSTTTQPITTTVTTTLPSTTTVTTTTIPPSGEGIIDNDKLQNPEEGDDLPVEAGPIQAVFDYNAMIEIEHRHGNNDIKFSYKVVEKEKLEENEAIKEALKDSDQLFEFDLSDSNGKKVEFSSDNNKGVVTITIPYNKPVSANEVKVFYISPTGEKIDMNGKYDPSTKTITFDTTHFSYYSIVAVYEESITTTTTTPVTTTSTTTATTAIITTTTTTAITTLPQTGYSDIYSIIIYGAGILTLLGIAIIVLSKRKEVSAQ